MPMRPAKPVLRRLTQGLLAAGLALGAGDAFALWGDKLELFASERLTYDSNPFRLSSGLDPQPLIGSSSRADWYSTTSAGLNLDVPWSRQRFQGGYQSNVSRFDKFTQLDNTGYEGRALWLWQAGNDLSGTLGYTEAKNLASFAYLGGGGSSISPQTFAADPLTTKLGYFTAIYNLTPSWRLRGGVNDLQQTHQNDTAKINDVEIRSSNAGLAYVTAANNQFGVEAVKDDADYPNRLFFEGAAIDNSYRQTGAGIFGDWTLSGSSHFLWNVRRVHREFPDLPQRDFSAWTYRLQYDWTSSPRFVLSAVAAQDVTATEDTAANFVLAKTVSLLPTYRWTEKTVFTGIISWSKRDSIGDPGFGQVPGLSFQPGREDKIWVFQADANYHYSRNWTFIATLRREQRTSNVQFADYIANIASLTARFGF
jgi:exopolysaccharide biosynthesis operon protein EpsL